MDEPLFDRFVERLTEEHGKTSLKSLKTETVRNELMRRLVFGFVEANSGGKVDKKRRTHAGLAALLGAAPTDIRQYSDESLLEYMAEMYLADRLPGAGKPRSLRALAKAAASRIRGHSAEATADRLRTKFRSMKEEYLTLASDEGVAIEGIFRASLHDIERILAHFRVKFFAEQ